MTHLQHLALRACMVVLLAAPWMAQAQTDRPATFVGTVRDAETDEPLPGAHVFIAASMMGTTTDTTGHFLLADVPTGAHRLYVSMLGYTSTAIDTLAQKPDTMRFAVELEPTVLPAGEVTVTAERDEEWHERLQKFERLFIGTSTRADSCTLLNPEVLSFDTKWWGRLTAAARAPLVIENRALGYRIEYHLEEFKASGGTVEWDGEPFFEPLAPHDSAEAERWTARRAKAYYGSARHFLRALLADSVREAGFTLYRHRDESFHPPRSRFRADADRLLDDASDSTLQELNFFGRLEIIYRDEEETERYVHWARRYREGAAGVQTSYVELNEHPVTVDTDGEIVEPYGATFYGYFAFERLADEVPSEYQPPSP